MEDTAHKEGGQYRYARKLEQRYRRTARSKQPLDKSHDTPRKPRETTHTTGHNK